MWPTMVRFIIPHPLSLSQHQALPPESLSQHQALPPESSEEPFLINSLFLCKSLPRRGSMCHRMSSLFSLILIAFCSAIVWRGRVGLGVWRSRGDKCVGIVRGLQIATTVWGVPLQPTTQFSTHIAPYTFTRDTLCQAMLYFEFI